jgi:hypothetical protein
MGGLVIVSMQLENQVDHNPNLTEKFVRSTLTLAYLTNKGVSYDLADQLRLAAKKDKRISYIIHAGKIASPRSLWKFRKYTGINPHHSHLHISFKPNQNGKKFDIPLLKGN